MKRIFLSITLILCLVFSSFAQTQRNYAQELVNMLHQERYFEARDFKKQYAANLPQNDRALDLVYDIHMTLAFNKSDSTTCYLKEFLSNRNYENIMGPIIGSYYGQLTIIYEDNQQYDLAISSVDLFLNYLERNPFHLNEEFRLKEIREAKAKRVLLESKLLNQPLRRIVRNLKQEPIKLKEGEYIRFDAQYNEQTIETLFDTGVSSHIFIDESLAREIGVKIRPEQDSIHTLNGKQIRAVEGVIDSIDLKGMKLYNIPAVVFKKKFSSYLPSNLDQNLKLNAEGQLLKDRQIIMGLPIMKMIGRLELDWEAKTLSFPQRHQQIGLNQESNFFLIKNTPYLNIEVNKKSFTGLLDTGANHFLHLTYSYFKTNHAHIGVDSDAPKQPLNRITFTETHQNVPYQIVKSPEVCSKNIMFNILDQKVYITDPVWTHLNVFDGEIGFQLIKKIGQKILFDFDNMTIEKY